MFMHFSFCHVLAECCFFLTKQRPHRPHIQLRVARIVFTVIAIAAGERTEQPRFLLAF